MLTEAERKRVLYHLDYAQLSLPTSLSLGLPIVSLARLVVEQNMLALDPQSEPIVREIVARLDCIILEADQARQSLTVIKTGSTEFREDAVERIWLEYSRWMDRLGGALGAQRNPVSPAAIGHFGGVIEGC